MSTVRRVGKSALVYGLQPVLSRIVAVVMLPVYTRLLTPADYGVLQLLETTVDVAGLLFTAGAINGVSRFYFKRQGEEERNSLLSTAFLVQLQLALLAACAVAALAFPIHRTLLKGDGSTLQVTLAAMNLATSVLMAVPLLRLQLRNRAVSYSGIVLAKLVLQLSLNIALVVVLRLGVTGVLLSTFVSNLVVGGGLALTMLRETGVRVDAVAKQELARFGRPVRLTAIGSYIMNFGDRWFLAAAWSTAVVGTYGLAYQFGFGFSQFFAAPIGKAWDPVRYQLATRPPEERNPIFLRVFELTNLYVVTAFVAVAVSAKPIIILLATPEYYPAATFIPLIVGAFVIQVWTDTFSFQINVSERTALYTRATWATAALMLCFYAVLIPPFGGVGAAWSTLIGFLFRAALAYRYAQMAWPVPYRWWRTARLGATAITAVAVMPWMPANGLAEASLSSAGVFVAYFLIVWGVAVSSADRRRIVEVVRRRSHVSELVR